MPIRFACEHCQQKLSVSSERAGAQSKCPRCRKTITVPAADDATRQLTATQTDETLEDEDPFAQFAVFDEDTEWVYEREDTQPALGRAETDRDPEKLAVSRHLVYLQGALLGIVGLVCFALGLVVGGGTMRSTRAESDVPQPCLVTGRVTYRSNGGGLLPDEGAVVVVLPRDSRPEQKAPIEGLVPEAPMPNPDDPGLMSIQSIGGDYTRTDVNGAFQLRVPDRGKYYLLVLSRKARRSPADSLRRSDLAQMGNFFLPAPDLLGQNQYRWDEQSIRRDTQLDFVFERP